MEQTYERLTGVSYRDRRTCVPRSSGENVESASERQIQEEAARGGAASRAPTGAASAPPTRSKTELAGNPEFEDFTRVRRGIGLALSHIQPTRAVATARRLRITPSRAWQFVGRAREVLKVQ